MIPGPLHYSQRSSSPVQINYHWCSINGSFQISPRRMPLICTQRLSLEWDGLLLYCCQRSVKMRRSSLSSFTFLLWEEVWSWLTLTTATADWLSPKMHTLHFLCSAKGICGYRWRVELQSGTSVWNRGWQTPTSPPPDGALSTNSTHIAFVCSRTAKPKASAAPSGLLTHPLPLFSPHGLTSKHTLLIFWLNICPRTLKSHILCNFQTL